jgi:hypothetical protein
MGPQADLTPASSIVLISRSCTTGWTDWIRGELWLSSEHLIIEAIKASRAATT